MSDTVRNRNRKPLTQAQRDAYDRRKSRGDFKKIGRKGGIAKLEKYGREAYRQMRAKRTTYRAGRAESEEYDV